MAPSSSAGVLQLGRDKQKRKNKPKRKQTRGPKSSRKGPSAPSKQMESYDGEPDDEDVSYFVMAEEGGELAAFEEEFETPQLFWRGDSRGPDEVFETGFTTKNEREGVTKKGANQIVWREGGATDDILPASAVCLAKDVRGSAFFPLTGESEFYLYAVGKLRVANTFKAQKQAEAAETGTTDFERDERYRYDPAYADVGGASAVWQFQEYAAHRVDGSEILACFKVYRRTLIPQHPKNEVAIAGIQFRLEFEEWGPIYQLRRRNKKLFKEMLSLADEAESVAARYEDFYPEKDTFLSYMGLVRPEDPEDLPQSLAEAPDKMRQIQPVVVQERAAGTSQPSGLSDAVGRPSNKPGTQDAAEGSGHSFSEMPAPGRATPGGLRAENERTID